MCLCMGVLVESSISETIVVAETDMILQTCLKCKEVGYANLFMVYIL